MNICNIIFYTNKDYRFNASIAGIMRIEYDQQRNDINLFVFKDTSGILRRYDMSDNHFYIGTYHTNKEIKERIIEFIKSYHDEVFPNTFYDESIFETIKAIDFKKITSKE